MSILIHFAISDYSQAYITKLLIVFLGKYPEKEYYAESRNIVETFYKTLYKGPSEIRGYIRHSILEMTVLFKTICDAWNAAEYEKYKTCNIVDPCVMYNNFKNMVYNSAKEELINEVQNIFDNHFNPFHAFILAMEIDTEVHEKVGLKDTKPMPVNRKPTKRLRISPKENIKTQEVKMNFNKFLEFNESYMNCTKKFPELTDYHKHSKSNMSLEELHEKLQNQQPDVQAFYSAKGFQRILIYLSLFLSMNNYTMVIMNSCSSTFPIFLFLKIMIVAVFCICPTIPFSIAYLFELLIYSTYGKAQKCHCKIMKKSPILKIIRKSKEELKPKKLTMRMYKRRLRRMN